MPTIWDDATIQRFLDQAEDHLTDDFPCLIDRLALDIVANTSEYSLPDYVRDIRRVTWLGRKVDPLPHRQMREIFQPATQTGSPYWYIYNNLTQNTIKLFPTPITTIATITTNLYGSEIPNRCIVEFYRAPDLTNSDYVIPDYVDRRIRKAYVLKRCFEIESRGQDSKASTYYDKKWEFLKQEFAEVLDELIYLPRKLILSSKYIDNLSYPSSPILPMDQYGISVDPGE